MAMLLVLGAAAAQAAAPAPSQAEPPAEARPAAERSHFDPAFFAAFAPRTAFDMMSRLPGFGIQEGVSVRGLSGGGGNVFVNGARPSTKDISLEDTLRQIPAASVRRIEIVDGSTMGLDAAGFRLVANVILESRPAGSGVATLRAIGTTAGGAGGSGQLAWKGQVGGFNLGVGAEYGTTNIIRLDGDQSIRRGDEGGDVAGPLEEQRDSRIAAANLSIGRTFGRLTSTATVSRRQNPFQRNALFSALPLDPVATGFENAERYRYRETGDEISLTNEATLGRHRLKLVLLASRIGLETTSEATFRFADRPTRGSSFVLDQDRDESIGRASWGAGFGSLDASLAVEAARNRLRARTGFDTVPAGQAPVVETTHVSEARRTVEAGLVWTPGKWLNLNAVVARETSVIEVVEPTQARNRYAFLRGRLVANLQPTRTLAVSAQFERTIGQLDFGDFVGSQQLFDGSVTVTNSRLRPSQTNSLSLAVDVRPSFGGGLNLRLSRNLLRDVVENIPVGTDREGVGNVARATELVAELSLTVPLASVWRGTELAVNGRWRQTRLVDPFNGEVRSLQGETGDPLLIELRRAADARLNYGLTYRGAFRSLSFRRSLSIDYRETPSMGFYVERTLGRSLKARIAAERLGGRSIDRDLLTYQGVRGLSPVAVTEKRRRGDAPFVQLRLERPF